ncbi:hypothetical protein D3C78_96220 [compost metagenome]
MKFDYGLKEQEFSAIINTLHHQVVNINAQFMPNEFKKPGLGWVFILLIFFPLFQYI